MRTSLILLVLLGAAGCASATSPLSDAGRPDAGQPDAGPPMDGGTLADGGEATDGGTFADGGDAIDGGDATDGGGATDGGEPADGGLPDGGGPTDGGPIDGGVIRPGSSPVVECPATIPAPSSGLCSLTPGSAALLLRGTVLAPDRVLRRGEVLVSSGTIVCVGCDCSSRTEHAGATRIECPDGVISPGLINSHDHLNWANAPPVSHGTIRYDHRNDWRLGLRGHQALRNAGSDSSTAAKSWGELRFLVGGATATAGSSSADRFLRNLDNAADQDGLNQPPYQYETFPLGSSGTFLVDSCNYPSYVAPQPGRIYFPHVAEGIDLPARNEFVCLSSTAIAGAHDVIRDATLVHAIALTPADAALLVANNTSVVWSPRSNISLYGMTAPVTMFHTMGVNIALGADWLPSGSMNLLRELQCADYLNRTHYNATVDGQRLPFFSDEDLWRMVTINAARAARMDDVIGALAPGLVADISIFDGSANRDHRAVVAAHPRDVALVLKGGAPMYGDAALVEGLGGGDAACERIADDAPNDCLNGKRICVARYLPGSTYVSLRDAFTRYRLFYCGPPPGEPTCVPLRANENNDGIVYSGTIAGDTDGDGIPDEADNCPVTFNPKRPVDGFEQADSDGDGLGDACDPCPLDPNTTTCRRFDPNDRDADGVPNASDNCPDVANPDQLDTDSDGKGDACDVCPDRPNPGDAPCPVTIYEIKSGFVPIGASVQIRNALVTAVAANGFYAAVAPGDTGYTGPDFSGIFVFLNATPTVVPGDRVSFAGQVGSFRGQTQIQGVAGLVVGSRGDPVPPPVVIADPTQVAPGGARAAALEAVLIQVGPVTVLAVNPPFFTVTGPLTVGNRLFQVSPLPSANPPDAFRSITGILRAFDAGFEIEPRSAADLVPGPPKLVALEPDFAYLDEGTDLAMLVRLDRPAEGDTVVTLSVGPNLVVLDAQGAPTSTVTIPDGQTSASFLVRAVPPSPPEDDGGVPEADGGAPPPRTGTLEPVTASLNQVTLTATIRIVVPTEPAVLASLEPSTATVRPNEVLTMRVSLNIPARADTVVTLSATGPGSVPASVTVPRGEVTAVFALQAGATTGTVTVTATAGDAMLSATIEVTATLAGLVINEVDYDQPGTDTTEFVEIYNGSGSSVNLTGLALVLVNGSTSPPGEYARVPLAGTLAAGGYLVVASTTLTGIDPGAEVIRFPGSTNQIQNGAPDGVVLFDTVNQKVIDALSYEGAITSAAIGGASGTFNLVEGTALPTGTADTGSFAASLIRWPDGADTDNAAADWKLTRKPTPGAPNELVTQ